MSCYCVTFKQHNVLLENKLLLVSMTIKEKYFHAAVIRKPLEKYIVREQRINSYLRKENSIITGLIKTLFDVWRGIAQSVERLSSDRRVGSSTLLAVQVPEIQNRSISGSKNWLCTDLRISDCDSCTPPPSKSCLTC